MDKYLIIKLKDVKPKDTVMASVKINDSVSYELSVIGDKLPSREDISVFYAKPEETELEELDTIAFLQGK